VQVTAQSGAELRDVVGQRHQLGELLLETGEVVGHLALRRLDDDGRRLGADAPEVLEGVRPDAPFQLGVVHRVDDDGGRVRIGGEIWSARAYFEGQVLEPGTRAEVAKIEGATALVYE
jgi:membrane protein implicated in regulation of membrane protease activity